MKAAFLSLGLEHLTGVRNRSSSASSKEGYIWGELCVVSRQAVSGIEMEIEGW